MSRRLLHEGTEETVDRRLIGGNKFAHGHRAGVLRHRRTNVRENSPTPENPRGVGRSDLPQSCELTLGQLTVPVPRPRPGYGGGL